MGTPYPGVREFNWAVCVMVENGAFAHCRKICFGGAEDIKVFEGKWAVVLCWYECGGSRVVVFYD